MFSLSTHFLVMLESICIWDGGIIWERKGLSYKNIKLGLSDWKEENTILIKLRYIILHIF